MVRSCGKAVFSSTPGRIRTCDLRFRKPSLYPLSYEGKSFSSKALRLFYPIVSFLVYNHLYNRYTERT